MPTRPYFQQTTNDLTRIDRKDHVWTQAEDGRWLCCLCGAVTNTPPPYPTPASWMPDRYKWLTQSDRDLLPMVK